MTGDLLARSRVQAESSAPSVRAAALLRIARVQTAIDPMLARHTFEQGLVELRQIPGLDGKFLLEQAEYLTAAVTPDLLRPIRPSDRGGPIRCRAETIGSIMLAHGHRDAAINYVMGYGDPSSFPFRFVMALMKGPGVTAEQGLTLLRRSVEVWREAPDEGFVHIFKYQWKVLPPQEALTVVREIIRVAIDRPDEGITAIYGNGTVHITSRREHTLFEVLHVLRYLDDALAESLLACYEQLAAAARLYPRGWEPFIDEAQAPRKQGVAQSSGSGGRAGSSGYIAYQRSLFHASRNGDFAPPMDYALESFRKDISADNPNQAPREFWPSTAMFRSVLHHAGRSLGPGAAIYLDRVPDADLRLFAQIELAAALAGLPELLGTRREYRPRPPVRTVGPVDAAPFM